MTWVWVSKLVFPSWEFLYYRRMPTSKNTIPFQLTHGPGFLLWSCSSNGVLSTWIPESSLLQGCVSSSSSLSSDQFWWRKEKHLSLEDVTTEATYIKRLGKFQRKSSNYTKWTFSKCLEWMELFLVAKIPSQFFKGYFPFNFLVLMISYKILVNPP